MSDLIRLKEYLLESDFPYFEDEELQSLLRIHNGDVAQAAFDGCMQKAQDDSIKLGPIQIQSNEKFWLRRASMVKGIEYRYLKAQGGYKPSRSLTARRYDD